MKPSSAIARLEAHPGAVIFTVALAVRLGWVLTLGNSVSWPDEREFIGIARHLLAGDGYIGPSYRANPILPLYLAAMFSLFGKGLAAARIGQSLVGALTCVLLYRIGTRVAGRTAGVVAGAVLAVYLPHIYLSGVFYVECLFTFFIALSVLLAITAAGGAHPYRWALACGISCGLAVLTRPVFTAVVPALCAAWIYAGWPAWRRHLAACAVCVLGCAAVILPWTVRNRVVYGRWVPVASGFYTALWQGNNVLAEGDADDRFFWDSEPWQRRLQELDPATREHLRSTYADIERRSRALEKQLGDQFLATDQILGPVALAQISANPGHTLRLAGRKVRTLFSAFTDTDTDNAVTSPGYRMAAAAVYYPVLAFAIAGALLGLRQSRAMAIIYAVVVAQVALYALLTACTRFRLPLDPYLILFAAIALTRLPIGARVIWKRAAAAGAPYVAEREEAPRGRNVI